MEEEKDDFDYANFEKEAIEKLKNGKELGGKDGVLGPMLKRLLEAATEARDGLLGHRKDQTSNTPGTVLNYVSRVRDILLGTYRGEEQKLGDYGFTVNHSSRSNGSDTDSGSS